MRNSTFQQFLKYLIPGILGVILLSAYIFADGFVIGQKLGSVALGAMGICTPVITFSYAFGYLFGMGGGTLYSISIGQNDKSTARRYFSTSLFAALLLSGFLAVVTNIFCYPLSYMLGANDENIAFVIPYIRCLLYFIPIFFLNGIFSSFMMNEGHPAIAMAASITSNLLNVIFDLVFVFVFDWGMFGAAFASCICAGIAVTINFVSSYILKMNIRFSIKMVDFSLLPAIARNGFSSFVSCSANGITIFVFIYNAVKLYGTGGAAIYTIIMNWALIFVNLMSGISRAAQPLLSRSYGEGDFKKVAVFRKYALVSSFLGSVFCTVLTFAATNPLIDIFGTDSIQVTQWTISAFRLYGPAFLFMFAGIIIADYFQAINSPKKASVLQLSRGVVLPIVLGMTLPLLAGTTGLWLSIPATELFTALLAVFMLRRADASGNGGPAEPSRSGGDCVG